MAEKLFKDVETQYGGGMKFAEGFVLKISGDNKASAIEGLIVQNLDVGAQRPVTVLYDLTSNKVYYVAGRCQTQIGLQRVCGPKGIIGHPFQGVYLSFFVTEMLSFRSLSTCAVET